MSRVTPIMRIDDLFGSSGSYTLEVEPFYSTDNQRSIVIRMFKHSNGEKFDLAGTFDEVYKDLTTITNIVKSMGGRDAQITERTEGDVTKVSVRPLVNRNTKGASKVKDTLQRNSEA